MHFKKRKRHKKSKFKNEAKRGSTVNERSAAARISESHVSCIRNTLLSRQRVLVWL